MKSKGGTVAADSLSGALKGGRNTMEVLAGFTAIRSPLFCWRFNQELKGIMNGKQFNYIFDYNL